MDCPSCQTSIPDDARFCPQCGHRFEPAVVLSTPPTSSPMDADKANAESAPADGAQTSAASDANSTKAHPTSASAIDLAPEDFGRAFSRALEEAGLKTPDVPAPTDPESLHQAGVAAGLDRKIVQRALHRISMEKLPADIRAKMGIVLDDEIPPPSRRWWLPVVAVVNVGAIALVVWALFFRPPTTVTIDIKPQQGTLDVTALEEPVNALSAAAQACYQDALKKDAALAGDVVLTLRIHLDGHPEAKLATDTLQQPDASACMLAAAMKQTWPAAEIAPVDVDIPFAFQVSSTPE